MTARLSADEIAAIRERHYATSNLPAWCACGELWPCGAGRLAAALSSAYAAEQRVRDLHHENDGDDVPVLCYECGGVWPCDTVRALDADTTGGTPAEPPCATGDHEIVEVCIYCRRDAYDIYRTTGGTP